MTRPPDDGPNHGTVNGYRKWKCRCRHCTEAYEAYLDREKWKRSNKTESKRRPPLPAQPERNYCRCDGIGDPCIKCGRDRAPQPD